MQFDDVAHTSLVSALNGASAVCKIADFGMARRMHRGKSHASGVRQGTPFYIAPEMVSHHRLHRSSDVFAFGVVMWELMRGCPVYIASTYAPPRSSTLLHAPPPSQLHRPPHHLLHRILAACLPTLVAALVRASSHL
jgi:serine/threonine protein kinase